MRNKALVIILALFLGVPAGLAMAGQALEIVYPADKTYFTRSDFLIIKGGDTPQLEGMTIAINGAASEIIDISGADYKAAFADFLILEPAFDPGKNKIEVDGYVGGKKVVSASADVYYLDGDPSAVPPAGYRPFVMHLPAKEALCAPCHNMTPDKVELTADSAAQNPCASCHRRMLNKKYVHGPASVYRCAYCHLADSKPNKYQPRGGGAELCNECHMDKVAQFKENKFVHGPVGAGLCLVCHDAHASDNPAQLLAPINDTCLNCHATVTKSIHVVRGVLGKGHPLKGLPDPSSPGHELSCASCHDPHGGAASVFFQRGLTGRFALCGICHVK